MASTRIVEHVGRVLGGRYRLLAPIGTGASAHVFIAEDVSLRRRVAVKILHPALADDAAFLRRFRAEAQAAAALNHPNVMAVYDWGEEPGTPYLVCELLGGGSLRGLLDAGHRLSPSQALLVGLQAARALEYAHLRGFVHRDIKPANLLFGEDARLRIADFGLARALAEAAWTEPAGAVLGTVRYASPEQARGSSVDGRADVYSLALVLVEAVTGRPPFLADTTIGTLMARVDQPLPNPPELGALGPALVGAGAADPAQRSDASALVAAMEAVAGELDRPEPLPLAGTAIVGAGAGTFAGAEEITDIGFTASPGARAPTPPTPPAPTPARAPAGPTGVIAGPVPSPMGAGQLFDADARGDRSRRRRWPRVVIGTVLAVLLAGGIAYAVVVSGIPSHRVPDERQKTEGQAVADVRRLGFEPVVRSGYYDDVPPGLVAAQIPRSGTLKEGRHVTLVVSHGPQPVAVPDLSGLDKAAAAAALERVGLHIGSVAGRVDESAPAGQVLDWVGKATMQPKGSAVDVVVSSGPAPRTIPDESGRSFDAAAADLATKGLVALRAEVFSDTVPKDSVVSTTPRAGANVERGSKVTVNISKGPDLVAVPDVGGSNVDDAVAKVQNAGLVASVFGPPKARRVFVTNPVAGTQVKRGSTVSIYTV